MFGSNDQRQFHQLLISDEIMDTDSEKIETTRSLRRKQIETKVVELSRQLYLMVKRITKMASI